MFLQVILSKYSSFKDEMEDAWLMKRTEPLQCCSRKIMGYLTHGTFSRTSGKAAGIGWICLKPLLMSLQMTRNANERLVNNKDSLPQEMDEHKRHLQSLVLVRNPSSLQYRWAKLIIITRSLSTTL